jgi:putative PIN family toxin of toxin-antitoxin system
MRVVIDCNILISAGLTAGTCRAVIQTALTHYQIIMSPDILAEYQDVLSRPKFARVRDSLEAFMLDMARVAEFVYPEPMNYPLPDPKDVPYLLAALASGAKYLVTGNGNDFPVDVCVGVEVVTPADFLRLSMTSMHQLE